MSVDANVVRRKLAVLSDAAKYDASCASGGSERRGRPGELGNTERSGICHSYTPDGRCVSLLRVLLTNHCIYDCRYCVNRASSDVPRESFSVEELVFLVLELYRRNHVEGLFLSSGIVRSVDHTMERLVAVARTLREVHRFGGYIHLKAIPGASRELLVEAGRYADRVSANIELPTSDDLARLAPDKRHDEVEDAMRTLRQAREESDAGSFTPAGQSTQMVVGATEASDAVILGTASRLYEQHRLARVYYTAYSPIPHADGRLPPKSPPLVREHRLYQADWLLRRYGFDVRELFDDGAPQLRLDRDPKLDWALRHRGRFPIDVNVADREDVLRIPGVGLRSTKKILSARRHRRLRLEDLARLGVVIDRARDFVVAEGHTPALHALDGEGLPARVVPRQLSLFEVATTAARGEL